MNNPVIQEAFDAVRDKIERVWKNSAVGDTEVREKAYYMLHALEDVRVQLTTFINGGKVVAYQRSNEEEMFQRERDMRKWDGSPDGSR